MSSRPPLSKILGGEPDERAVQRMWNGISEKLDRPRAARSLRIAAPALLLAAALLVLAVGRLGAKSESEPPKLALADGQSIAQMAHPTTATSPRRLALSDGSTIELVPGSALATSVNSEHVVTMRLERGTSIFHVAKIPGRTWTVESAGVRVVVTGTRFEVRRDEGSVAVHVEEGSVRVTDTFGRIQDLGAGDSVRISTSTQTSTQVERLPAAAGAKGAPSEEKRADPEEIVPPVGSDQATAAAPRTNRARAQTAKESEQLAEWHRALRAGDGETTLRLFGPHGLRSSKLRRLRPEELMQLADFAREARRGPDAVLPLQVILAEHATSSIAPLAAYTLGKLYLYELSAPSLSAAAFETAIGLGLPQSLREGAYARRAEAYGRSQQPDKFAEAKKQYRLAFPKGKQLRNSDQWLSGP